MGRRQGEANKMGHSLLVKDRFKRRGQRRGDNSSFLHTADLDDGVNYNRINFQSVTEQSNLEDFLTTAEMAGKDFTAERQNISIITSAGQPACLTEEDMVKIAAAQNQHRALLQVPRRPHWDETTTKEQLLEMEREAFTNWRRQLKLLQEEEHIELTPYEKNLDFWRQLWRVIERSDVITQIVDARNPLLFRCEDLDAYVKEVDPKKTTMLLINKADYLTDQQRSQWVEYFNKEGITVVFFSAKIEQEKQENLESQSNTEVNEFGDDFDDYVDTDSDNEEDDEDNSDDGCDVHEDNEEETNLAINPESTVSDCDSNKLNYVPKNDSCDEVTVESLSLEDKLTEEARASTETSSLSQTPAPGMISNTEKDEIKNSPCIVTAEELLDIFRSLAHISSSARKSEVKTIGMVGYPNVGKSSTINVILQEKKLAVSATPGRTKHLQTLFVDDHLMLCDCPGLVFPSFVATKAHLVINGILPIDELRDHIAPTSLVCQQIPRNVLEATYSIMIPRPSVDDDQTDRLPTAEELLNAYGGMRGFMNQRGVPDGPRASRYILKDYVKGKLLFCDPVPGIPGDEFQDKDRINKLEASRLVHKAPPPQIKSSVDKEFFAKKTVKANSRGAMGVSDFIRVDNQHQVQRTEIVGVGAEAASGSNMGSHMSLNSSVAGKKSWKKHNNKNKREKLRRLHRDLDAC